MNWLAGIVKAVLQVVLPFLWDKAKDGVETPDTIKDEKIDTKLSDALNADLADKLRSKQNSNPSEWDGQAGK